MPQKRGVLQKVSWALRSALRTLPTTTMTVVVVAMATIPPIVHARELEGWGKGPFINDVS